ncbi:hypothetical protein PSHT_14243 [Puccinia striiformis]|uniref:PUM-HD domain-containing protein n=1 Tax=Puccinia striiformis TaxID=27350 RepID=A0A2S4UL76_9BASI|nr:hypothetical protein PSHT_14243 [Puccinia striiformis]
MSSPTNSKHKQNNRNNMAADLTRAEAIGLYRSGNISSLPPSTGSSSSTTEQASSTAAASTTPTTTRRPRAGTLPSSFNSLSSPLQSASRPDLLRQYNLLAAAGSIPSANSLLSIGSAGLYSSTSMQDSSRMGHPIRSDINLQLALDKTRPRAGTVALPPSSASSYFGRGVFSTNFVPRSSRMNEELRSIRSDESALGENEDPDEAGHVRTLDYLGLDADSPVSPTVPHQPQSAFVGSSGFYHHVLNRNGYSQQPGSIGSSANPSLSALANRMRASTISGVAPSPSSLRRQSNNLSASPFPSTDENCILILLSTTTSGCHQAEVHDQQMSAYSALLNSNPSNGLLAPISRPRANTLGGASLLAGMGGQPTNHMGFSAVAATAAMRNRAGTLAGFPQHSGFLASLNSGNNDSLSLNPLNYQNWMSSSRPITPDFNMAGIMQQPSRSLWIGNFDPSTTAQELMNECGFINYVSVHDAVHAKDDIVNRLEGQINLKNGPTCIRIGFGKPESAPQTPASLLTTPIGSARGGAGGSMNGLSQTMMMLSLTNIPGPNGIVSSTQINNVCPNPTGYTNVGGIMLGPNGDPVLQSSPTRALWVGSIPSQTTPNHLMDIFSPYGAIESVRVLSHKNCGFINFEHLDDAVRARKALSGREILGSEVGAVKIGYAKVPVKAPGTFSPAAQLDSLAQDQMAQQQLAYETLARMKGASAVVPYPNVAAGFPVAPGASAMVSNDSATSADREASSTVSTTPLPPVTEMQLLMKELCKDPNNKSDEAAEKEYEEDKSAVAEFRPPVTYYTTIPPPINQLDPHRRLVSAVSDPARLREIRKRFDSNTLSQEEMDQIARELLEEIIYLSSDYIGNTIVQKLFEKCFASNQVINNGTWAAQKMIDCANTEEEMRIISTNLRPFGPPLLLDSLGNYVMQCCLRFGSPYNDFVFDSIIDRIWEISQGRFGARSIRTCLESKFTSKLQIKKIGISVILNSIPLSTNPNGTLLLTWLLDSSNLSGRFRLLAPRLTPHLSHLSTHKLASITVLRIINQNFDPTASQIILDGIFNSSATVLEEITADQSHGSNLLLKILTSNFIDPKSKSTYSAKIKDMLISLRVQHIPAYKKLAEEVGISIVANTSGSGNGNGSTTSNVVGKSSIGGGGGGSTPQRNSSSTNNGSKSRNHGGGSNENTLWSSSPSSVTNPASLSTSPAPPPTSSSPSSKPRTQNLLVTSSSLTASRSSSSHSHSSSSSLKPNKLDHDSRNVNRNRSLPHGSSSSSSERSSSSSSDLTHTPALRD